MRELSQKLIFLGAVFAILAVGTWAQDGPPPQEASQFERQEARPNLIANLGLSQDQIRQIQIMNRDRKPRMEAAQRRLREANRDLDMAIYGDALDENAVQARMEEFQLAQSEVARIRFLSELELRKILTPEQLVIFRGLRARLAEARQNMKERRRVPPDERPLQRIRQLPRRSRIN